MTVRCHMTLALIHGTHPTPNTPEISNFESGTDISYPCTTMSEPAAASTQPRIQRYPELLWAVIT
jgi:hypothetical protein